VFSEAGCNPAAGNSGWRRGRRRVRQHARWLTATETEIYALAEVRAELQSSVDRARAAGISDERIVLDPGFGFAKRTEHSLELLRRLPEILALGFPVLIGLSRKRMVGELSGIATAPDRDIASAALNVAAFLRGAGLFRVHAVAINRTALDVVVNIAR
jgi:dihydropteroate synthase